MRQDVISEKIQVFSDRNASSDAPEPSRQALSAVCTAGRAIAPAPHACAATLQPNAPADSPPSPHPPSPCAPGRYAAVGRR